MTVLQELFRLRLAEPNILMNYFYVTREKEIRIRLRSRDGIFFNVVGPLSRTSDKVHIQFLTVSELRITELTETSTDMLSTK